MWFGFSRKSKAAAAMYAGFRKAGWNDEEIQTRRIKVTSEGPVLGGESKPRDFVIKPDSTIE